QRRRRLPKRPSRLDKLRADWARDPSLRPPNTRAVKRIIDAALEIAAALGDRRAAADLLVEISRTIRRRPPPVSFRKRGRPKDSVKYPLTDLARMIGRMEAQHEP